MINHNNEFNAFIILHITRLYNDHDYTSLERMSIKPSLAKEITNMSIGDIERLCNFNSLVCEPPSFDEARFEMLVKHIHREGARNKIIDRMILLDASQAMLYELAGIDNSDYRDRRRYLNLPKATSGRPASISEKQTTLLHEAWGQQRNEEDMLLRYFKVGVATRIPLSQIWQHIHSDNSI